MAGPNSFPAGNKAEHARLMEEVCIAHNKCVGDKGTEKKPCVFITRREWYLRTNRLYTGKTR